MSGYCASKILALLLVFFALPGWAQDEFLDGAEDMAPAAAAPTPKKSAKFLPGKVLHGDAVIFQNADFDSEVVANIQPGQKIFLSLPKKGPFYFVKTPEGVTGWALDSDVAPAGKSSAIQKEKNKKISKQKTESKKTKSKSITQLRYHGPTLEMVNFTEDTMGALRREYLLFYGYKWSGNNTLIDGDMYLDSTVLMHFGAPQYYQKATGQSASGWAVLAHFQFMHDIPQSKNTMSYFGFGPAFKYSHFDTTLNDTPSVGQARSYTLDDITVGALFTLGIATKIGLRNDLRLEFKYYWETQRYYGLGLAWQWQF